MIIDLFSFCISKITLTSLLTVLFKYTVPSNPAVPHLSGTRTGFSTNSEGWGVGGGRRQSWAGPEGELRLASLAPSH